MSFVVCAIVLYLATRHYEAIIAQMKDDHSLELGEMKRKSFRNGWDQRGEHERILSRKR